MYISEADFYFCIEDARGVSFLKEKGRAIVIPAAQIERLRFENLQSRCDALANQINPHFFFNSLNGISSLIRKKDDEKTLMYVHQLSDIFRYILQSDRKGLVSLREELEFMLSFQYVMEVRLRIN